MLLLLVIEVKELSAILTLSLAKQAEQGAESDDMP